MKRVRLHLALGGVHPVYELLTTSPSVERASSVHWNVTEDGTLTMLHWVLGEIDGIESALEGIDQLEEYEVFPVDGTEAGGENPPSDGGGNEPTPVRRRRRRRKPTSTSGTRGPTTRGSSSSRSRGTAF